MAIKTIVLAALCCQLVFAYPPQHYSGHYEHHGDDAYEHHAPAPYNFEYGVHDPHTHDIKSQHEVSDGHGNVKGSYSLLEADGSTRVVEYTADDHHGFVATVKKIEPAHQYHGEHAYQHEPLAHSSYTPSYSHYKQY